MSHPQQITVLGATGSIGLSTLDVIARHPERYQVFALSGFSRLTELLALCIRHVPQFAVVPEVAGLFCQDWGGLLGLRIVGQEPERFAFVVASNTFLPTGGGKASPGFLAWREFARSSPDFKIGGIMDRGCQSELSAAEVAAYDAPFPDEPSKAGARAFPQLVPVEDDKDGVADNIAAWEGLAAFYKPFLTLFGEDDPVLGQAGPLLAKRIKGADGQPHAMLPKCGHFSQEDRPAELSQGVIDMARQAGVLA